MSSVQQQQQQQKLTEEQSKNNLAQLGALEEDDEFEEFAAEGKDKRTNKKLRNVTKIMSRLGRE